MGYPTKAPRASHPYFVASGSKAIGFHFLDSAKRHMAHMGGTLYHAADGARLNADGSLSIYDRGML